MSTMPVLDAFHCYCSSFLDRATKHFRAYRSLGHYNDAKPAGQSEDHMDQQLKELMKGLGDAINKSLSESGPISDVVSRIKEDGYDIFLVLEATIGVNKQGEKISIEVSNISTSSNKLRGKIEEVQLGDLMAHVAVRVGDNLIESEITRRSADNLKLKKGDTVFAVVKAAEVMIQKD
jgi:molybdopterin-binding protein